MSEVSIKSRYEIKELELNSLLEVTQAINNNVSEDYLYKIYNFTLRSNLKIKKIALYVLDDEWNCKVNFGTQRPFLKAALPDCFKDIKAVIPLKEFEHTSFSEFDIVLPVAHKESTLALVFLGDHQQDGLYDAEGLKFIQALSNIIIVAIENKKLVRKQLEQEAFRKELEIASDVQQFLFPEKLPNTDVLNVEASYLPHDIIGGDYYDYVPINKDQFLLCIADVSGKGVPAALLMSNFQASLRTLLRQTPNLRDIVEALNYQILENAKGEKFITFFACIYDISLKTLVYVNAGHNPPILCDKNGIRLLEDGCTVLGIMHPLPFLNEGFITDLDYFRMFCYTDGLTETINEAGDEFGMERLMTYFNDPITRTKNMRTVHSDIIVSLDDFKGRNGYHDDITMISCRVGYS